MDVSACSVTTRRSDERAAVGILWTVDRHRGGLQGRDYMPRPCLRLVAQQRENLLLRGDAWRKLGIRARAHRPASAAAIAADDRRWSASTPVPTGDWVRTRV
jgi:hypothetical protein